MKKMIDSIVKFWKEFAKKRYINQELKRNYNLTDYKRRGFFTKTLFKSSIIVNNEVAILEQEKELYEREELFKDINNLINKHFKNQNLDLIKENKSLLRQLKSKGAEKEITKKNITKVLST